MATVEQLTIQFQGKGASVLTGQLTALSTAMNRLAGRQAQSTKATKKGSTALDSYNERLTKNGRNVNGLEKIFGKFGRKMSQIRSQLLIVAFAAGVLAKVIFGLAKQFQDLTKAQGKINAVLKSTGMNAGVTRKSLEKLADEFQNLKGISNTAVLEMSARFLTFTNIVGDTLIQAHHAAADLAVMFGGDLNQATIQLGKALNDPIKGYTALRRIGVSFSAQQIESIKNFQKQGQIIKAQNVILEELKLEMGGTAEEIRKAAYGSTVLENGWNTLGDAGKDLGRILQPIVAALGVILWSGGQFTITLLKPFLLVADALKLGWKHSENFAHWLSMSREEALKLENIEQVMNQVTRAEERLSDQTSILRDDYKKLAEGTEGFTTAEQFKVFTDAMEDAVDAGHTDVLAGLMETYSERVLQNSFILNNQITAQQLFDATITESTRGLKLQLDTLNLRKKVDEDGYITLTRLTEVQKLQIKFGEKINSDQLKYAKAIDEINDKLEAQIADEKELKKQQKLRDDAVKQLKETINDFAQFEIDKAKESATAKLAIISEEQQRELQSLRARRDYQRASDKTKAKWEKEVVDKHEKLKEAERKAANKRMADNFRIQSAISATETIISAHQGAAKATGQLGFFGLTVAQGILIAGYASAALILAQKPPKMQYGGLVGGQPHSRGGTMIEAERGEYMISRKGVDAIGLEALNRINAGGGGGTTNITFSGNVLSKDFIEDEAIPQIKEALRRGGDIGVS